MQPRHLAQRDACLPDGGFDILRMPIGSFSAPTTAVSDHGLYTRQYAQQTRELADMTTNKRAASTINCQSCSIRVDSDCLLRQATEMTDENDNSANSSEFEASNLVDARLRALGDRLTIAIRGQRAQVLERSGISDSTLARVLRGDRVRRGTLVSLAHAAGVNIEWLEEGTGEMQSNPLLPAHQSQWQSQGLTQPEPREWSEIEGKSGPFDASLLRGRINLRRLGAAIRIAERRWTPPPVELRGFAEAWITRAKDVVDLYDELTTDGAHTPVDEV